MLGHKTSLSKFRKIKIIPSIFSNHSGTNLEINNKKTGKLKNTWELKNALLNNQQIKEEIKKEVKICTGKNKNENMTAKTYGIQ